MQSLLAFFVLHHPNHFILVQGVNSRNMIKYFSTFERAATMPPQDFRILGEIPVGAITRFYNTIYMVHSFLLIGILELYK